MSRKSIVTDKHKTHRTNLIKMIDKFAYKYSRHTVWNDFIYLSAAALSQPMDYRQNREDEYLRRIKVYDKESQDMFPQMLAELILAFEQEGFGDILGEIYSQMGLTSGNRGQVFTPYNVTKMMGKMMGGSTEDLSAEIEHKGYITAGDMCCGAGAMLIAFADNCMEQGINYQDSVLFVAQDIDPAAALMCHVQMSLLGLPGYVIIGDSLSNQIPEESSIWYTPFFTLKGFQYRTQKNNGIIETEAKTNDTAPQPEPQKTVMPVIDIDVALRETGSGQFTFDFAS